MFWLLLLAGPSDPSPMDSPAANMVTIGATPDPRYMLLTGLCETFASNAFITRMSSPSTFVQWTPRKSGPRIPVDTSTSVSRTP